MADGGRSCWLMPAQASAEGSLPMMLPSTFYSAHRDLPAHNACDGRLGQPWTKIKQTLRRRKAP